MKLTRLSNRDLVEKLKVLRGEEKEITLKILLYFGEMDRRKLFREYAYSSLFAFVTEELGYSDSSAGRRISAARCLTEHPELADKYLRGEVTLSALSAVSGTLRKEENTAQKKKILEQLPGSSRKEVEKLIAESNPKQQLRESVKPVAVKKKNSTEERFSSQAPAASVEEPVEQRYQIRFSVSESCMKKLQEVTELMSNRRIDGGQIEGVFEAMLDEYVERHSPSKKEEKRADRKIKAEVKSERDTRRKPVTSTRHVPQAIGQQVYLRDGGQCTYIGVRGKRCSARTRLHLDHLKPYALGGEHTLENLRLLCSCHNRLVAEQVYGKEYMAQFGKLAPRSTAQITR